jgi:hypothetical protein
MYHHLTMTQPINNIILDRVIDALIYEQEKYRCFKTCNMILKKAYQDLKIFDMYNDYKIVFETYGIQPCLLDLIDLNTKQLNKYQNNVISVEGIFGTIVEYIGKFFKWIFGLIAKIFTSVEDLFKWLTGKGHPISKSELAKSEQAIKQQHQLAQKNLQGSLPKGIMNLVLPYTFEELLQMKVSDIPTLCDERIQILNVSKKSDTIDETKMQPIIDNISKFKRDLEQKLNEAIITIHYSKKPIDQLTIPNFVSFVNEYKTFTETMLENTEKLTINLQMIFIDILTDTIEAPDFTDRQVQNGAIMRACERFGIKTGVYLPPSHTSDRAQNTPILTQYLKNVKIEDIKEYFDDQILTQLLNISKLESKVKTVTKIVESYAKKITSKDWGGDRGLGKHLVIFKNKHPKDFTKKISVIGKSIATLIINGYKELINGAKLCIYTQQMLTWIHRNVVKYIFELNNLTRQTIKQSST